MWTQLGQLHLELTGALDHSCLDVTPQSHPHTELWQREQLGCSPCPPLPLICNGRDGGNLPGETPSWQGHHCREMGISEGLAASTSSSWAMPALICKGHWGRGTSNIHCANGLRPECL